MDVIFLFKRTICLEETDVWFVLDTHTDPTEVIDELLDLAGVGEQVRTIRSGDEWQEVILKKALNNAYGSVRRFSEEVLQVSEKITINKGAHVDKP
jgi:hypothetical protein